MRMQKKLAINCDNFRSPLRISLGGGGTDLPSYYKKKGGYLIAASINKYIFISIGKNFNNNLS